MVFFGCNNKKGYCYANLPSTTINMREKNEQFQVPMYFDNNTTKITENIINITLK